LDIHELAAGKLNALIERDVSRDLFDSHRLLTEWEINPEKLRLAFTVYAAMRKSQWRDIVVDKINFSVSDIRNKLIPVLKRSEAPGQRFPIVKAWANNILDECKSAFGLVLPFKENEIEFLDNVQTKGIIQPELISNDKQFCENMRVHPLLLWRAGRLKR
jgi:hypothetical protein